MDLWSEIKQLEGKIIKTLDQRKPFEVVDVNDKAVIIKPFVREIERRIPRKEIEESYRELVALGQINRNQIMDLYSPWNPAFVAAILAELPDVTHTIRPIVLYYKGEK
jgi:hypothetical protein